MLVVVFVHQSLETAVPSKERIQKSLARMLTSKARHLDLRHSFIMIWGRGTDRLAENWF